MKMLDYNHLLHMGTDATTWAQEFKAMVEADPRTLDDERLVTEWFQAALDAGEEEGYDRGRDSRTYDYEDGYDTGYAAGYEAVERNA